MAKILGRDKEEVEGICSGILNEALESINAEYQFRVVETDMENKKFIVEFDIVDVEEDDYIGISGY
jgi:hypothetical protein